MREKYTFFLASCLLFLPTVTEATKPLPPFKIEDLIQYAADQKFDGIHHIRIRGENNFMDCSSVALDIDLPYLVHLTAAHCLQYAGKNYLSKEFRSEVFLLGNHVIEAAAHHIAGDTSYCFTHPLYPEVPQHDVGVCFFPKEITAKVKYPFYTGDLNLILDHLFTHMATGR